MIPAGIVVCLVASVWAAIASGAESSLVGYFNTADPEIVSDAVLGGLVVCCFLVAVGLSVMSTLRRVKQSKQRRNAFRQLRPE